MENVMYSPLESLHLLGVNCTSAKIEDVLHSLLKNSSAKKVFKKTIDENHLLTIVFDNSFSNISVYGTDDFTIDNEPLSESSFWLSIFRNQIKSNSMVDDYNFELEGYKRIY